MSTRIIPPTSELTQPYWDASGRGELLVQRCERCGHRPFPPRTHCPACGAAELEWAPVAGTGTVYTFTVARRPPHPVFAEQCPLIVAVVELTEGPRLFSNLVNCAPEQVSIGMPVRVTYEPVDDSDIQLPVFEPA